MDHIIADLNRLCSSNIYLRFADDLVRLCRAFYHLLVMDGAKVAAALLCDVNHCPVCTCPHSELDLTDRSYPFHDTESLKEAVNAAREKHMDAEGHVLPRHKEEILNICPNIVSDIVTDVIIHICPDIVYNVVHDVLPNDILT